MVKGSQPPIMQIRFNSNLPNTETIRLEDFDVHQKSFSWIPHLPTFWSFGLVVVITLYSKDNKEENIREVAEIRMYHFSWNLLQLGNDML